VLGGEVTDLSYSSAESPDDPTTTLTPRHGRPHVSAHRRVRGVVDEYVHALPGVKRLLHRPVHRNADVLAAGRRPCDP